MVVTPGGPDQGGTGTLTVSDPNNPLWFDPARPYVLVVADPANAIAESDESGVEPSVAWAGSPVLLFPATSCRPP